MPRGPRLKAGGLDARGPNRWRYRVKLAGRDHSETITAENCDRAVTVANGLFETWNTEAQARGSGANLDRRMSELLEEYEAELKLKRSSKTGERRRAGTLRTYSHSFARMRWFFRAKLDDPPVHRVRPEHVKQYLDWALSHRTARNHDPQRPRSERTVGRDYTLLRDLFEYAADLAYTAQRNPVTKRLRPVPPPTRKPAILTDAEVTALLNACGRNEQLRGFIAVQDEVGARPGSETMWLRWDDVDFERRHLHIREHGGHLLKTSASVRSLPISDRLVSQLRCLLDWYLEHGVESPWVFCHRGRNGEGKPGERLGGLQSALRRLVRGTPARSGALPERREPTCPKDSGWLWDLRAHDFRHRRAKKQKDAMHPLELRREFLGHSNPSMTDAYAGRADPETLRPLVEV